MPLFSAKTDYALRAAVDLALQPPDRACQSRDIAARQDIRGPYLDQILAVLKRQGIVRSVRGAGGGYLLARNPRHITVGEIVRAVVGDRLLLGSSGAEATPETGGAVYIVRQFEGKVEAQINRMLDETTLADLVASKQCLDDALSIMPSI